MLHRILITWHKGINTVEVRLFVVGNGHNPPIHHTGSSTFCFPSRNIHLKNILHVPKITKNLLSISKLTHDNNVIMEFHHFSMFVKDKATRKVLPEGTFRERLYRVNALGVISTSLA